MNVALGSVTAKLAYWNRTLYRPHAFSVTPLLASSYSWLLYKWYKQLWLGFDFAELC